MGVRWRIVSARAEPIGCSVEERETKGADPA
jgi:hypothetical protein